MTDAFHASAPPTSTEQKQSGTWLRVATVIPLIPMILALMFAGPAWGWHLFVLCAIAIGGYELMAMKVRTSRGMRLWGAGATVLVAAAMILRVSLPIFWLTMFVIVIGAMASSLFRPEPIEEASGRVAWLIGGPIYVGGALAMVGLVRDFPMGGAWVLLTMVLAWASDTFAYFSGRKFGKTKLYPQISPKKTVEGAIGGLCGSITGAVVMSLFMKDLPTIDAIALAVIAGILGQAGDLLESLLKRSSGVKDSGTILPGHGGLLDRVDALMFTAPVTWAYGVLIAGFWP